MTLQKNVKSHVFLDFEKNVKNVFSNYGGAGREGKGVGLKMWPGAGAPTHNVARGPQPP